MHISDLLSSAKVTSTAKTLHNALLHNHSIVILAGFVLVGFTTSLLGPTRAIPVIIAVFYTILFLDNIKIALLTLFALRTTMDQFWGIEIASSVNPSRLFGVFFLVIGFSYLLVRKVDFLTIPVGRAYFIFLVVAAFAIPNSTTVLQGLYQWSRLAIGFLVLVLVFHVFETKKEIETLTKAFILSLAVPISIMGYQHLTGGGIVAYQDTGVHSIVGGYRGGNSAASSLAVLLPMVLFRFTIQRGRYRFFYFVLLAAVSLSIMYTYLRTAMFGMVTQLLSWSILRKAWIFLIILVLLLTIAVLTPSSFRDRVNSDLHLDNRSLWETIQDPDAASGRFAFNKANILYFLSSSTTHKLIGSGFGRTIEAGKRFLGYPVASHNDYTYLLVCNGLFGLLAYLWLLVILGRETVGLLRHASDPYLRSIGYAFMALFLSFAQMIFSNDLIMSVSIEIYFWGFAGIVLAAKRIHETNGLSANRAEI